MTDKFTITYTITAAEPVSQAARITFITAIHALIEAQGWQAAGELNASTPVPHLPDSSPRPKAAIALFAGGEKVLGGWGDFKGWYAHAEQAAAVFGEQPDWLWAEIVDMGTSQAIEYLIRADGEILSLGSQFQIAGGIINGEA